MQIIPRVPSFFPLHFLNQETKEIRGGELDFGSGISFVLNTRKQSSKISVSQSEMVWFGSSRAYKPNPRSITSLDCYILETSLPGAGSGVVIRDHRGSVTFGSDSKPSFELVKSMNGLSNGQPRDNRTPNGTTMILQHCFLYHIGIPCTCLLAIESSGNLR
ncbi:hypothetical protein PS2_044728 [Malus domestica]